MCCERVMIMMDLQVVGQLRWNTLPTEIIHVSFSYGINTANYWDAREPKIPCRKRSADWITTKYSNYMRTSEYPLDDLY